MECYCPLLCIAHCELENSFLFLIASVTLCSAQSQDSQVSEDSPVVAAEVGERLRASSGPSSRLDNTVGHVTIII